MAKIPQQRQPGQTGGSPPGFAKAHNQKLNRHRKTQEAAGQASGGGGDSSNNSSSFGLLLPALPILGGLLHLIAQQLSLPIF
jgi:hypothetical protein